MLTAGVLLGSPATSSLPDSRVVADVTNGQNGITSLGGPRDVEVFSIGTSTYAFATGYTAHGVQIIDVTNPSNPLGVGVAVDDVSGLPASSRITNQFTMLDGPRRASIFVTGGRTYAIVSGYLANGVQLIDVSDPSNPSDVGFASHSSHGHGGSMFTMLASPTGVDTFVIGTSTYAIVCSYSGNGVQLIDISNPATPVAVGALGSGQNPYPPTMYGAWEVKTFVIGSSTYAIVTAFSQNAIQIIDVSDPTQPAAVSNYVNSNTVKEPKGVTTMVVGTSTYALVCARKLIGNGYHDGLQIFDLTANLANLGGPIATTRDNTGGMTGLDRAEHVSTFVVGATTYAMVAGISMFQLIDVTNPAAPTAASVGFLAQSAKAATAPFVVNDSMYAAVTSYSSNGLKIYRLASST